ncbi:hypothetical protein MAPG_00056, partial [Magnaporthiopsis poae ATCC 64411]
AARFLFPAAIPGGCILESPGGRPAAARYGAPPRLRPHSILFGCSVVVVPRRPPPWHISTSDDAKMASLSERWQRAMVDPRSQVSTAAHASLSSPVTSAHCCSALKHCTKDQGGTFGQHAIDTARLGHSNVPSGSNHQLTSVVPPIHTILAQHTTLDGSSLSAVSDDCQPHLASATSLNTLYAISPSSHSFLLGEPVTTNPISSLLFYALLAIPRTVCRLA